MKNKYELTCEDAQEQLFDEGFKEVIDKAKKIYKKLKWTVLPPKESKGGGTSVKIDGTKFTDEQIKEMIKNPVDNPIIIDINEYELQYKKMKPGKKNMTRPFIVKSFERSKDGKTVKLHLVRNMRSLMTMV